MALNGSALNVRALNAGDGGAAVIGYPTILSTRVTLGESRTRAVLAESRTGVTLPDSRTKVGITP